jgi:hypothetical protein
MRNFVRKLTTNVLPVHPFSIPNANTKRNSDRFVGALAVLRFHLVEALAPRNPGLGTAVIPIIDTLDKLNVSSQEELCEVASCLRVWFLAFIATGSREQGNVPDRL